MGRPKDKSPEMSDERLEYIADNFLACAAASHGESVAMAEELLRLRKAIRKHRSTFGRSTAMLADKRLWEVLD